MVSFLIFGKVRVLRYPSLRAPLDILFLVCCIVLTADVLGPEIFGNGKTKEIVTIAGNAANHGSGTLPDPVIALESCAVIHQATALRTDKHK